MTISKRAKIEQTYHDLCTMTADQIAAHQTERLKEIVNFHFTRNSVYRQLLEKAGVQPRHLQSTEDLKILPILDSGFLTKYKDTFYSCPEEAVTYLHTSGSTGESKIIPVTAREKQTLAFNDALTAYILGVRKGPVYCTYPCGPWPSSFFAQNGAEMLAPTIRADMGLPIDWHLPVFQRFQPKVIMASPSYISYFVSELEKRGVDVRSAGVDVIKLAGEPLSVGLRHGIANKFNAMVMDLYGCAEFGAASVECAHLRGSGYHHYLSNELIFEVKKIGSPGELCEPGEQGELLVTALFRESVPIIRYNTRDIVQVPPTDRKCECGLGLPISSTIRGRSDDMVTYGGANVFPDMVYKALASIGMDDKFQVRLETSAVSHRDRLVIQVEGDARTENDIDTLEKTIESHLREQSAELDYVFNRGLVNPIRFDIVDYGTLYDRKGKFKHFLDTRQTVVTGEATTN